MANAVQGGQPNVVPPKVKFGGKQLEELRTKGFNQYFSDNGFFSILFWGVIYLITLIVTTPFKLLKCFRETTGVWGFLIFLIILFYVLFISGWGASLARVTVVPLYQGIIDPALEAVLPGFKENLVKGFRVVLDPESAREEFDPSAAKEVNTGTKGVIFESVSKNRDVYFVGDNNFKGDIVEIFVRAKVYGLNDVNTNVRFS